MSEVEQDERVPGRPDFSPAPIVICPSFISSVASASQTQTACALRLFVSLNKALSAHRPGSAHPASSPSSSPTSSASPLRLSQSGSLPLQCGAAAQVWRLHCC